MHTLDEWIREISPELKQLDSFPLTGAPSFPWNNLGQELAKVFDKNRIELFPEIVQWRTSKDLLEGFEGPIITLAFSSPPLKGDFYWIMSEQALNLLKSIFLTQDQHPIHWEDKILDESFCRFLALEVLYQFSNLHTIPHFTPILLPKKDLITTDALCLDVSMAIDDHSLIPGRLIMDPEFHHSWIDHLTKKNALVRNEALAKKVDVILHIEAGQSHLNLKQWQEVSIGDFILLDHCSLQGEDFQGRVTLTAHSHPIFLAKLKEGKIKILDFPLYHEVQTPMKEKNNNNDEKTKDEDELENFEIEDSFDFNDTEEESVKETTDDEAQEQIDEEAGIESDQDNESIQEEQVEEVESPKPIAPPPAITPEQIPVSLVVELGRIQMTVGKLLEIEPGNFLELEIHPENGVDLVINGKPVGKGELIRLGEALGIRILELG